MTRLPCSSKFLLAILFLAGCSSSPGGDGACSVNGDCDKNSACVGGRCIAAQVPSCTTDDECALGEVCDPTSSVCITPAIITCTDDTACPGHQRCNQATGVCVDGARPCTSADDCPGRHCELGRQLCVECLEPSHCSAPETCIQNQCIDPMNPMMMNECIDDPGCNPPMTICEANECVLGCANPGGIQCMGEEICDTNTGRCVSLEGPCMTDAECTPPQTICEFGQCIPGCQRVGGLQCSGGEVCNPSTGRCRAGGPVCTSDLDCNAPTTICNLFSGACEPGCGTSGCEMGKTCNQTTGHCEGNTPCMTDRFEPNDTAATASMINGGQQGGLTICAGDEDFFQIALGTGDTADVTVTFVHGEGNIDLSLLDPNGTVIQTSASMSGSENVAVMATVAGVYTVRVHMVQDLGPNPGNTYTLNIVANVAACPDDSFEDNDQDFGAPFIFPGSYPLNVCVGDEDYFDVILTADERLDVTANFSHAEGDIDIQILGFLGIPLANGNSSTDDETASYTAGSTGFFTVRVALFTDTGTMPGNPYSLDIAITAAPPAMCTADGFEPNDSVAAATSLPLGNHANLHSCTDDDYYSMSFSQGDAVTIAASFVDAEGDIDLELAGPSGANVATAATSTDDETISYTVATAGTHTLRVLLYGDAGSTPGNPYTLNVGVAGSTSCASDSFEPNQTRTSAPSLTTGTHNALSSCDMDDDFYGLAITNGTPVTIDVAFVDAEGDIDVTLLDPNGTVAASSASNTDNETITYNPTMSGTFALRVYLYGDAGSTPGNTYSINASF